MDRDSQRCLKLYQLPKIMIPKLNKLLLKLSFSLSFMILFFSGSLHTFKIIFLLKLCEICLFISLSFLMVDSHIHLPLLFSLILNIYLYPNLFFFLSLSLPSHPPVSLALCPSLSISPVPSLSLSFSFSLYSLIWLSNLLTMFSLFLLYR